MASMVPLSLLSRYPQRHLAHDQEGALDPGTVSLRSSCCAGCRERGTSARSRITRGWAGRVWFAGGGAALATLIEGDVRANNTLSNTVFTGSELNPLTPVVALAHLRSQINDARTIPALVPFVGGSRRLDRARPRRPARRSDYAALPRPWRCELRHRSRSRHPASVAAEPVLRRQRRRGVRDRQRRHRGLRRPRRRALRERARHAARSAGGHRQPSPSPAMLYYHGRENGPVLFSGFDLWSWSRSDARSLVDFVLRDVWGLTRSSSTAATAPASAAAGPARETRARRLDPCRSTAVGCPALTVPMSS
jgi:hypothetical protein